MANYDIREIIEITPTPDCLDLMRSRYCLYKYTPSGILVGIKAEPDEINADLYNPFASLENDLIFRFIIRLKDMSFLNFTALPLPGNSGSMYVFKNYKFTAASVFPSLSAIPPVYAADTEYLPGDMLSDHAVNQNRLFTALVKTVNNTSTVTDWLEEQGNAVTPMDYANLNDRHMVASGFLDYTMKVGDAGPVATIKNSSGLTVNPKIEIIKGGFYSLRADLRNFPEGFYSLHVESNDVVYSDDLVFYLIQQSDHPFGLIEIKVKSNLAGYDLLDQGHLAMPVFVLRFRNRRTHWRYSGKSFATPFVVTDPLPLTRFGHIEITKPPDPEDDKIINLPNPADPAIRPEALIKEDEKKYYSDIHIN